mmetsp:Transcript_46512/g.61625  ORF Transcript_46512/g.61625 Transcript_46512/m.61625 type:complete len:136 (+) Transcript_46512:789-1196(+)|eukprot:CAMPEP_0185568888 /NCGR_PEP_ID=MMETSP0434-20130131/1704_1 /TAXON_ID=626734 ORGANISM="Favella taraikaensis, Strain Fe Narragansett Bay" /NCGR_SAMPLE_ID=MMETSP0434 /ASSEMBLY_ACC=CAM_ASM_000379 /LENGTH=135 /DNA_ID=CAMNT_0028183525 /DNA_START=700 /DNA_END=1107 /DNA_ORIENTATION=-
MSSVGYGDMYAVTPVGRFLTLIATFLGVIFLSLMVALITQSLALAEREALSVHKVKDQQRCARSIQAALQYHAARQKRYRLLAQGDTDEYCPTVEDLLALKARLHSVTKKRADCPEKQHMVEVARQEHRMDMLQD